MPPAAPFHPHNRLLFHGVELMNGCVRLKPPVRAPTAAAPSLPQVPGLSAQSCWNQKSLDIKYPPLKEVGEWGQRGGRGKNAGV